LTNVNDAGLCALIRYGLVLEYFMKDETIFHACKVCWIWEYLV